MNIKVCEKCKHFAKATNGMSADSKWIGGTGTREIYCLISDMIDGTGKGNRGRFLGVMKEDVPTFFSWFSLPEKCPYQLEHLMDSKQ